MFGYSLNQNERSRCAWVGGGWSRNRKGPLRLMGNRSDRGVEVIADTCSNHQT